MSLLSIIRFLTIIVNNEEYITQEGLENSSAKLLPINSVIMAMYGKGTAARVDY